MCYKEDILLGLVVVVNEFPENDTKTELIKKLCQPFATALLALSQNKEAPTSDSEEERKSFNSDVAKNIDKLDLIAKSLSPAQEQATNHVMINVFSDLWPLISLMLEAYFDNERLIEKICKFIKHTMRCVQHLFQPFIEPFFKLVIKNYEVGLANFRKSRYAHICTRWRLLLPCITRTRTIPSGSTISST